MQRFLAGKRVLGAAALALAVAGMTGCEWEGSGDGDFWSTRYNYLNFSGVYRPTRGRSIILSYEAVTVADAAPGRGIAEERVLGHGNGVLTTFSGVFPQDKPVIPGSLSITAGGFHLVDDGVGLLEGGGATGNINYETGAWAIDLGGVPLDAGTPVLASYRYLATGGGERPEDPPGSTHPVYQFTVQQTGNQLTLIDNYGHVYRGRFGTVDVVRDQTVTAPAGPDPVLTPVQMPGLEEQIEQVFSFTAEGEAHGMPIRIVGAFTAQQVAFYNRDSETGALTESHRMVSFMMEGTWFEPGGRTGYIEARGPSDQRIIVPIDSQ